MPSAEDYAESIMEIGGRKIKATSYRIGENYYCHITNVDPDATIARGEGKNRAEAEDGALRKAMKRLGVELPSM
jgi:hypothetical protein